MILAWVFPRKPGAEVSSVARHPPISCLLSKMPTLMPAYFIRYIASIRPLLPPPTITASNERSAMVTPFRISVCSPDHSACDGCSGASRSLELAGVLGLGSPLGGEQQRQVLPLQDAFDHLPDVRLGYRHPDLPLHRFYRLYLEHQVLLLTYQPDDLSPELCLPQSR